MNDKEKEHDENQDEKCIRKRPYHTPSLTKLGSVEQLTRGTVHRGVPDDGDAST